MSAFTYDIERDKPYCKRQRSKAIQCTGSMSLAFCIVLPAILLLFTEVLRFSRTARADADLARHARMAADTALAHYDRDLYRTFGLFGVKEYKAKKALDSDVLPSTQARLALEVTNELKEKTAIKDGIARHMTWRTAASILSDAIDKMHILEKIGRKVNLAQLSDFFPTVLKQGYEVVDPDLGSLAEVPEWKDEYESLMDTEIRQVYQQGLMHLAPIVIPRESDDGYETIQMNPFNNSGLQKLGSVIDRMLFVAPEGVFDRLILSEYTLSYFYNDVPFVMRQGVRLDDYTPDGRMISQFPNSRRYEAEEIATGLKGKSAKTTVLVFIGAIRFAVHLMDIVTDEAERASYKAIAVAIAAAVTAISQGIVSIPPIAIEWILMSAAALARGAADVTSLNKGLEVDCLPGKKKLNLKLRYRDFLRVLMIAQSPDIVSRRIAQAVDCVFPGPYYTSVACFIESGDARVRFDASYLSRLPDKHEVEP
ncbi:MAG TPA: hypothetical protein GX734_01380 [Clostridiaceae bacterium]|nr:hypothetical protein [Clostridiaceae bacterium]